MAKVVTQLLQEWRGGDFEARDELLSLCYKELKQLASQQLRHERRNQTLQPTALVHELYLRIAEQPAISWNDRAHFFGIAAKVLRQILVDHARSGGCAKRGGTWLRISLDDALPIVAKREIDLVQLDDALLKLKQDEPRHCEIVELRFFGGLSIEETAAVMGISPATVKRDWSITRAWLYREMGGAGR